jgi:hypothetical protein
MRNRKYSLYRPSDISDVLKSAAALAMKYPSFLTVSDDVLIDIVSAAAAGEPLPLGSRKSREEVLAESAHPTRRCQLHAHRRANSAAVASSVPASTCCPGVPATSSGRPKFVSSTKPCREGQGRAAGDHPR